MSHNIIICVWILGPCCPPASSSPPHYFVWTEKTFPRIRKDKTQKNAEIFMRKAEEEPIK